MTTDTQAMKKRLQEELASLTEELETIAELDPDNKIDWVPKRDSDDIDTADRDSVADSLESYDENRAILNDLEPRYNSVKAALARIEAGTYGTCTVCGNAIEADRLNADPDAPTCKAHMDAKK